MEPENISVEVTIDGRLVLHGDLRSRLKEVKELLLDEWSIGVYHRELALPVAVDAECANVTYGNGVLIVTLPITSRRPLRDWRCSDALRPGVSAEATPGAPRCAFRSNALRALSCGAHA